MSFGQEETYTGHPASEEADVPLLPEELIKFEVEKTANYDGNWTELLFRRVKHPISKERFLNSKRDFPTTEHKAKTDLGVDEKGNDIPRDEFNQTIFNYDKNINTVFSHTGYETTQSHLEHGGSFHEPSDLGVSQGYGDQGTVFINAEYDGRSLKDREKTIIEAHEKAHGLFMNLTKEEERNILSAFDLQKLQHKHKAKADEILARMSQLKNYFGFKGDETFTKAHLEYARSHYVEDVGLDNSISNMFNAIADEDRFIKLMNTVAC